MREIKAVDFDIVKQCGFKPFSHTVEFVYDPKDTWYAYCVDGNIAAVISVSQKHGGMYIGVVYTDYPYRRKGIAEKLIRFVTEVLYPDSVFVTHALVTSKRIFEKCGFEHYRTVAFKYGTQYFMRLER